MCGTFWVVLPLGMLALGFAVAPMATQPAQAQLEQLPSVADLAERLLPSVVEISVQTKSDTAGPPCRCPNFPTIRHSRISLTSF